MGEPKIRTNRQIDPHRNTPREWDEREIDLEHAAEASPLLLVPLRLGASSSQMEHGLGLTGKERRAAVAFQWHGMKMKQDST